MNIQFSHSCWVDIPLGRAVQIERVALVMFVDVEQNPGTHIHSRFARTRKKNGQRGMDCCRASSIAFAFVVLSIAHTGMDAASFMMCSRASISNMTATDCASVEFMDFAPKFCHEAMTRYCLMRMSRFTRNGMERSWRCWSGAVWCSNIGRIYWKVISSDLC